MGIVPPIQSIGRSRIENLKGIPKFSFTSQKISNILHLRQIVQFYHIGNSNPQKNQQKNEQKCPEMFTYLGSVA
jgi:hypothetical protein